MMTIFEKEGWITYCNPDEKTGEMPISDFFQSNFLSVIEESKVFVYNFQGLVLFIIKALVDAGFTDITKYDSKLESRTFKYVLSGKNHTFYSLSYKYGRHNVTFYEFQNLVSANIVDIVNDFGGTECVAMHRAALQVLSYAPRSSTVSGCAYNHWKNGYTHAAFEKLFGECGEDATRLCRWAYHGGLCFIKDGVAGITQKHGVILDVNSLYPWVMKSNYFAICEEHYCNGELPDNIRYADKTPYYVHFKARFELKENHIPFVRTRCDKRHWQLEILKTSAYFDGEGNRYDAYDAPGEEFVDEWGEIHKDCLPFMVELCMYRDEFELFFEQYDVFDIEYIDYVWFKSMDNVFTSYVDEFYEMKKNATGKADRRIAKIFQNALSGRMSLIKEHESLYLGADIEKFLNEYGTFEYRNKNCSSYGKYSDGFAGESIASFIDGSNESVSKSKTHIQIGAAITSIAMCYIVRCAQANYDHFLYTDTDSLHLDCELDEVKGVEIGKELGQFKVEHYFWYANYHKPKIYTIMECGPDYTLDHFKGEKVTWAGMPESCQWILEDFLTEAFLHTVRPLIKEERFEAVVEELRKRCRPAHISDEDWDMAMRGWYNHMVHGELFKMGLPYVHRAVKSYKNFELEWKTEWYHVDMLQRL